MLACLDSEVHQIECIDEVDETTSKRKWTKKADDQLKKLNNDCNMTAGLEAILMMAVGARVMLRRNIDTKIGLVNGALGTVVSITGSYITVKFDHINEPYDRRKSERQIYIDEKLLHLSKAISINFSFCHHNS